MSSSRYKVFCITEGKFVSGWDTSPLTECPNDSGHEVNPDSVCEHQAEETCHRLGIQTNSTTYTTAMQLLNRPSAPINFMKVICSTQDGAGQVRLYDITNVQVLAESSSISNTNPVVIDLPEITYVPSEDTIVEIQVKKTSGSGMIMLETAFMYN